MGTGKGAESDGDRHRQENEDRKVGGEVEVHSRLPDPFRLQKPGDETLFRKPFCPLVLPTFVSRPLGHPPLSIPRCTGTEEGHTGSWPRSRHGRFRHYAHCDFFHNVKQEKTSTAVEEGVYRFATKVIAMRRFAKRQAIPRSTSARPCRTAPRA